MRQMADRTTRTSASRGGSRSGSWLRPDGRSGSTSWRPPSSARSRPSSDTRGCELRNLQWLVPTGRPCGFPRCFARVRSFLPQYQRLNATHRQRAATSSRKRHSHAPCGGTRSIGSHIARSVRSACWAALRRSLGTPRARPPIMAAMAPKNKSLAQINKSAGGGRATNEAFGPT
jgi:hypothetical protein